MKKIKAKVKIYRLYCKIAPMFFNLRKKKLEIRNSAELKKIARDDRVEYYQKVIDIIREKQPEHLLEIGPGQFLLVKNSDSMDMQFQYLTPTYFYDATITPWPIGNKKYDMLVALQVWEHLAGKQTQAFLEVMRISKAAILSFPYKWKHLGKDNCHYDIDEAKIAEWTLNIEPKRVIRAGKRIIYFFEF